MLQQNDSDSLPHLFFLGPTSSYTHQAALSSYGPKYEYQPATTISDVFEAVQSGIAKCGVVPFENSTNGPVIFTLELLADRFASYPDILVCGEIYLDIRHCLLGHKVQSSSDLSGTSTPTNLIPRPLKPKTKPNSSLDHVKRIYSHPQAFGQCEAFLTTFLKGVERIDVSSTSKATAIVAEDTSKQSVAIASSLAAEIHKVDILGTGIEDREDNTTRFFVLRKGNHDSAEQLEGFTKTLISLTIDHRKPGALADALDCFRRYKLNLTSINSRPTNVVPFQYIFFVEFEGSRLQDPDGTIDTALKDLEQHTQSWRWLGSWADRRKEK